MEAKPLVVNIRDAGSSYQISLTKKVMEQLYGIKKDDYVYIWIEKIPEPTRLLMEKTKAEFSYIFRFFMLVRSPETQEFHSFRGIVIFDSKGNYLYVCVPKPPKSIKRGSKIVEIKRGVRMTKQVRIPLNHKLFRPLLDILHEHYNHTYKSDASLVGHIIFLAFFNIGKNKHASLEDTGRLNKAYKEYKNGSKTIKDYL